MKGFLSRHGVDFEVRLLTDPANHAEVARHGGSLPLTLVGDEAIFGLDKPRLLSVLSDAGLLTHTPERAAATAPLRLEARAPLSEALAIASFHGDALNFVHARTGRYLGPGLERSSVAVPGHPIAVEACPSWGTLAVVTYEGGGVTWLRGGSYLHGDLESSSTETGELPLFALAHPEEPLLYVSNSESCSITVLDPRDGRYAFGSRERSSFGLPGRPGIMALHRSAGRLYVRLQEGAIVILDARTLQPARATMEDSCFEVGRGRGVVLGHDQRVLYVPETAALGAEDSLAMFDASTGRPRFGTRERSTLPTGPTPLAITAHPSRPIVYVSCFGSRVIELRDGETGAYLHGSAEASSVPVGSGARAVLVDGETDTAFVTCFDESELQAFDAVTGAPRSGAGWATRIATGGGPRGMALLTGMSSEPAR